MTETRRSLERMVGVLRSLRFRSAFRLLRLIEDQYGHGRSRQTRLPVDRTGAPIPWYTYPAYEYLQQLDFTDADIFEYGGGHGTAYWAKRCRNIHTVENDEQWAERLKQSALPNQRIEVEPDLDAYAESISRTGRKYDVVIIDGRNRHACAEASVEHLASGGLLIFDNSDWWPHTAELLRDSGLLQVDFKGLGPVNDYTWTTSVFFSRNARPRPLDLQPSLGIGGLPHRAGPGE